MKITEAQQIIKSLNLEEKIALLKMLATVPSLKNKIEILEKEYNIKVLD
jgi:hypothetical protein